MICDTCQLNYTTRNIKGFTSITKSGLHFLFYPYDFSQSRLGNKNASTYLKCTNLKQMYRQYRRSL